MSKKKPYYIRSLLKLKPRIRQIENVIKQDNVVRQNNTIKQNNIPDKINTNKNIQKTWTINLSRNMVLLIIFLAGLAFIWLSPDSFITVTTTTIIR